jgi:hypothetical protein
MVFDTMIQENSQAAASIGYIKTGQLEYNLITFN